ETGNGQRIGVIVKFPVGPCELRWTTALGTRPLDTWNHHDCLALATPRVVASGHELGGYDLAWLITERLQGPSISSNLSAQAVTDLLSACADFQGAAARAAPVEKAPEPPHW